MGPWALQQEQSAVKLQGKARVLGQEWAGVTGAKASGKNKLAPHTGRTWQCRRDASQLLVDTAEVDANHSFGTSEGL